jgi:CIC family chloride channel protein
MEILLKDFTVRTFTPVMVASVLSVATTQAVLGRNEAIFAVSEELARYRFEIQELPSYLVLGLVCGVVAVGFVRLLYAVEDLFDLPRLAGVRVPEMLRPMVGAGLMGLLGIGFLGVVHAAGGSADVPNFFGNGYETIRAWLEPSTFDASGAGGVVEGARELSPVGRELAREGAAIGSHMYMPTEVWLLGVLVVAKGLATALTLGSGGSGGVFAPSLFLGAGAGALVGVALTGIGLVPTGGSPAAYALVGMAAVVAGTTHAPLTAVLVLFELTSDYKVILPIMLAAVVSTALARLMLRDSVYTLKLRRRGMNVGGAIDHTMLRKLRARDIAPVPHVSVRPSDPLSTLLELRDAYRVVDFVVLDGSDRYAGLVTGQDLRTALIEREAIPYLLVAELVREDLPVITPEETLDSVLKKFGDCDVSSLALVDGEGCRVQGLITRGRLMRRYNEALNAG